MSENKNAKTPADDGQPVAWMYTSQWKGNERFITTYQSELTTYKADKVWPLYKDQTPCKTCQALAMAVMNDQTYHEKVIPKREWVGLTDEEIQDLGYLSQKIDEGNAEWFDRWEFARAIEAKLKEKNT